MRITVLLPPALPARYTATAADLRAMRRGRHTWATHVALKRLESLLVALAALGD